MNAPSSTAECRQPDVRTMAPASFRDLIAHAVRILFIERRLPYRIRIRLSSRYYIERITRFLFKLVRLSPPVYCDGDSSLETITLLDGNHVDAYLIAVKSLFYYSALRPRVTVISDGTISPKLQEVLHKHIVGIRIVSAGPDSSRWQTPDVLRSITIKNVHSNKLLAIPPGDDGDTLIFLDSDIIFVNTIDPDLTDLTTVDLKYNRDHDHRQHDPLFYFTDDYLRALSVPNPVHDLNSGLIITKRKVIRREVIEAFYLTAAAEDKIHAVIEQDCFNVLASLVRSEPLSDRYWVGCNPDHTQAGGGVAKPVAKHYVSGVRYKTLHYLCDAIAFLAHDIGQRAKASS